MELYIVRHGETLWNKEKRLQGRCDVELSENGRALAKETGENLMDTRIDVIYSSPLMRARETAELIRNGRPIPLYTDDRLREMCFGSLEGQNIPELFKREETTFQYFFKQPHLFRAPADGETFEQVIARATEFMQEVVEPLEKDAERVMIVAHGALNKAIISYIKKHSTEHFWSGGVQTNCNVIIVDYTDGVYTILDETKTFYKTEA